MIWRTRSYTTLVRMALLITAIATLACETLASGTARSTPTSAPPTSEPTKAPDIPTATALLTPIPTPSPVPTANVTIAYSTVRRGNIGIHFLSADGQLTTHLETGEAVQHAVWPDITPDGYKITFTSLNPDLMESNGIFAADIDGSNLLQLVYGNATHPKWSRDATRIAYTCRNEETGADICVLDLLNNYQITNLTVDSERDELYPSWTPDGRIVFMSNRDVSTNGRFSEIYIMNADGSGIARLTNDKTAYNANPSVSPDGALIAFETNRDEEIIDGSEIYIMGIDGGNPRRVTLDTVWNQNPVWSPDGRLLLFAANYGDGNIDLYQIDLACLELPGGCLNQQVRLTNYTGEDGGLRWGHTWLPFPRTVDAPEPEYDTGIRIEPPIGVPAVTDTILFATDSTDCADCLDTGIYSIRSDGSGLVRMPVDGFHPAWEPNFRRYAFVQNGELFIANADSTEVTQMTHAYLYLSAIIWGNEGKHILADCAPYTQHDACLIEAGTGLINNLTEEISFDEGIPFPSWAKYDIALGTTVVNLQGDVIKTLPLSGRVSPEGRFLAYIQNRQLYVMTVDGLGKNKLTTDAPTKGFPVWSPDEKYLIYTIAPGDGRLYLYMITISTKEARQLVPYPIALGPENRPGTIEDYYGYSWGP